MRQNLGRTSTPVILLNIAFAIVMCFPLFSALAQTTPEKSFISNKFVLDIVYPSVSDVNNHDEYLEILQMALIKTASTFGPFTLKHSRFEMNAIRTLLELEKNRLNIAWSSTSIEMESRFIPIRIPLGKGILGYRIPLILKEKQALFDHVNSLNDLQKLTVGQGHGWQDVKVYRANGINVIESESTNLFRMTTLQRFDYFPLGINEIFEAYELNLQENPALAIEEKLLIYYPWPIYFFFNKNDVELKNRIELGMRKMIADGSFDAIFKKYNAKAIEQANLPGRKLIELQNYLLPKETPIKDASLWFRLDKK